MTMQLDLRRVARRALTAANGVPAAFAGVAGAVAVPAPHAPVLAPRALPDAERDDSPHQQRHAADRWRALTS